VEIHFHAKLFSKTFNAFARATFIRYIRYQIRWQRMW